MVMHVQTSAQLLKLRRRQELIERIQSLSDPELENWEDLYGVLIATAAEFYQLLPTQEETSLLLDQALRETVTTLLRCREQTVSGGGEFPKKVKYFATAAALYFDFGQSLADLEVTVYRQSKAEHWNPLIQPMIGAPGTPYDYRWTSSKRSARCTTAALAFTRLPPLARNWLCSDSSMLNAWFSALIGDFTSELAPLLRQCDSPVGIPKERMLRRFIQYLRAAIAKNQVNRQQDRIHRVKDGLFIMYPEAFEDFSVFDSEQLYEEIKDSDIVVPSKLDPKDPFWRYRANNDPNKLIRGLVLDMRQHELSLKVGFSAYLTDPVPRAKKIIKEKQR